MLSTELKNSKGGERKIRTSVLFLLKFEALIRPQMADVEYAVGYIHLELGREIQSGNINMEVIHRGWYLEQQGRIRIAEDYQEV